MKDQIKPVTIATEADIRKAIVPFQRKVDVKHVQIKSDVKWVEEDEKGNSQEKSLTVTAINEDANLRELLIQEFDKVKGQRDLWGKLHDALMEDAYSAALPTADLDKMYMSVDRIIKHRLGGHREGLTVFWQLGAKKYVFDPYTGQLTTPDANN